MYASHVRICPCTHTYCRIMSKMSMNVRAYNSFAGETILALTTIRNGEKTEARRMDCKLYSSIHVHFYVRPFVADAAFNSASCIIYAHWLYVSFKFEYNAAKQTI